MLKILIKPILISLSLPIVGYLLLSVALNLGFIDQEFIEFFEAHKFLFIVISLILMSLPILIRFKRPEEDDV